MTAGQKVAALLALGWKKSAAPVGKWIKGRNVNAEVERRCMGFATRFGGALFYDEDGRFFVFQVWRPDEAAEVVK